jgi:cytochrome c-type protein NapB
MRKSLITGLALALGTFGFISQAYAEKVVSLRGDNELNTPSNHVIIKRNINDREPIERDYVQQPPLIPHNVERYKTNLKVNKCLTCHSWVNYKDADATKISQTHFSDRNKDVRSNVAARRYFCLQCHVPQADVKPLVKNDFQPLKTIHR